MALFLPDLSSIALHICPLAFHMAATAPIKMEMDSPSIKHDPDSLPQSQAMEEDDYEDTGELEMPAAPEKVWLLRVPRVLHQCWDSIDQDQEIAIGVVRRGKTTGKARCPKTRSLSDAGH